MGKFGGSTVATRSPIETTGPSGTTFEGMTGFARDAKSELFLLAVTNMVGEKTFYEDGKTRDARFERLVHQVTQEDPAWIAAFVPYLRDKLNMRSASVVMAAEYVKAGGPNGRRVIAGSLLRADEPAEMIGYWTSRYGRRLPKPIKRGIADAIQRLYTERAALKYDGDGGWRMADVIDLTHPTPLAPWQGDLFAWLLAKRHNRDRMPDTERLPTIAANRALLALPLEERRAVLADPQRLNEAAITWEALSGWLQGPMDAQAWEAIIPSMGYMALLRNLRNFEDAKVSKETIDAVRKRLVDPDEVARSRQLPMRFYSAWKATESLTFGAELEQALDLSLANVPVLRGRTLVLIDVSSSMVAPVGGSRSKLNRWEAAAIFGVALARRAEHADTFAFDDSSTRIAVSDRTSVLRGLDAVKPLVGGGTNTMGAVNDNFKGHDRIVILTDEQAGTYMQRWGHRDTFVLPDVQVYTFNLAGYEKAHAASSPKHHTFGGLTDAGFAGIAAIEQHRDADWSFLRAA